MIKPDPKSYDVSLTLSKTAQYAICTQFRFFLSFTICILSKEIKSFDVEPKSERVKSGRFEE